MANQEWIDCNPSSGGSHSWKVAIPAGRDPVSPTLSSGLFPCSQCVGRRHSGPVSTILLSGIKSFYEGWRAVDVMVHVERQPVRVGRRGWTRTSDHLEKSVRSRFRCRLFSTYSVSARCARLLNAVELGGSCFLQIISQRSGAPWYAYALTTFAEYLSSLRFV